MGTEENKKEKKTPPKRVKRKSPLPKKEPSAKRIRSQRMLTRQGLRELASPNHSAKLIGTAVVTSPSSSEATQSEHEKETNSELEIKPEIKIKTEEDLLIRLPPNVPRKVVNLQDPNVLVTIRHTDGSLCHSKKSYALLQPTSTYQDYTNLPDLPDLSEKNTGESDVNTESSTPNNALKPMRPNSENSLTYPTNEIPEPGKLSMETECTSITETVVNTEKPCTSSTASCR